jgi:Holliday junction resolvasome RuvABC endonuclease subunit
MIKKLVIGIDPGTNFAGWAVTLWTQPKLGKPWKGRYIDSGTVRAHELSHLNWRDRMDSIVEELITDLMDVVAAKLNVVKQVIVVIEEATQFTGSERGEAAIRGHALIALIAIAYTLRSEINWAMWNEDIVDRKLIMVTPPKWKGQVPKEVMAARIKRDWSEVNCESLDEFDAIGLARWYGRKVLNK